MGISLHLALKRRSEWIWPGFNSGGFMGPRLWPSGHKSQISVLNMAHPDRTPFQVLSTSPRQRGVFWYNSRAPQTDNHDGAMDDWPSCLLYSTKRVTWSGVCDRYSASHMRAHHQVSDFVVVWNNWQGDHHLSLCEVLYVSSKFLHNSAFRNGWKSPVFNGIPG